MNGRLAESFSSRRPASGDAGPTPRTAITRHAYFHRWRQMQIQVGTMFVEIETTESRSVGVADVGGGVEKPTPYPICRRAIRDCRSGIAASDCNAEVLQRARVLGGSPVPSGSAQAGVADARSHLREFLLSGFVRLRERREIDSFHASHERNEIAQAKL